MTVIRDLTDRTLSELEFLDRRMVEHGVRPPGGRGRGARKMTAMDAARFLIAVSCPGKISDIPEQVHRIGSMPLISARGSSANMPPRCLLPVLESGTTYERVLARLIGAVGADPAYQDRQSRYASVIAVDAGNHSAFGAKILTRGPCGSISLVFEGDADPRHANIISKVILQEQMFRGLAAKLFRTPGPKYPPRPAMTPALGPEPEGPVPG